MTFLTILFARLQLPTALAQLPLSAYRALAQKHSFQRHFQKIYKYYLATPFT
jgi:hypothetical protein